MKVMGQGFLIRFLRYRPMQGMRIRFLQYLQHGQRASAKGVRPSVVFQLGLSEYYSGLDTSTIFGGSVLQT